MGIQNVDARTSATQLRAFITSLLRDIKALEKMIADGMIEAGVRRIGAEQELFLVNPAWRPAPVAAEVLDHLDDPHFTNEIALFNLEINLDPLAFGGDCLSRMERQLDEMLARAAAAANRCEAEVILTGILPTIRKSDLGLRNMTPKPRYFALNDALKQLRGGGDYEFKIGGPDELIMKHDTWMLEACCTSFQAHLQVGAEEFANHYNAAQLATAPVLAAAANSPLLFGRRLWRETRIPLFEQSIDTRNSNAYLRERSPRVSFGQGWVRRSVLELFEEDISRFRVLLGARPEEDPFAILRRGETPPLSALRLYNGTVWRWNRACYGVTDGRPHLRIEARALPSGPTVVDEVANAAFFYGLTLGLAAEHPEVSALMKFDDARANFFAAARQGLDAQFAWTGGRVLQAPVLIQGLLLPIARDGLRAAGIDGADVDRYLGVIEERVRSRRTGSQWLLNSAAEMRKTATKDEVFTSLTAALARGLKGKRPVHTWPLAEPTEGEMSKPSYLRVEEFMTTDLFTVHADEPLDLVASLMDWKRVRHIPVEDEQGMLVGLLSCFEVLRHLEDRSREPDGEPIAVSLIMNPGPLTITPETLTLDAIAMMRREKVDCLPVVKDGRLVGIVSERDFITIAARLLEKTGEGRQGAEPAPQQSEEKARVALPAGE